MKSYKQLIENLVEAWPGTSGYKKPWEGDGSKSGNRHDIERKDGVVKATRKYDKDSGESEDPKQASSGEAPVKRGRGRPPGKYGSYKKKVKESLDIIESLESEEEVAEFIDSLDEESFEELHAFLESVELEEEKLDELSSNTLASYFHKAIGDRHSKDLARDSAKRKGDDKEADRLGKKVYNRSVGLEKSKEKFFAKEEVEQIEEISKDTLTSYINKTQQRRMTDRLTGKSDTPKGREKERKRSAGVGKASEKLRNHYDNIDEVEQETQVDQEEKLDESVNQYASFLARTK